MDRDYEDQIVRLAAIIDGMEDKLKRIDHLIDGMVTRCATNHSQIQRDLGNLDGRTAGISALISMVVAGVIAYISQKIGG